MLFYPCIMDAQGRILKKVSAYPMTKDKAESYLKEKHWGAWLMCNAIPQPANMRGLHD